MRILLYCRGIGKCHLWHILIVGLLLGSLFHIIMLYRVIDEIHEVVGGKESVEPDDLGNLKYLHQVSAVKP